MLFSFSFEEDFAASLTLVGLKIRKSVEIHEKKKNGSKSNFSGVFVFEATSACVWSWTTANSPPNSNEH